MSSKIKLICKILPIIFSCSVHAECTAKAFANVSSVDDITVNLDFTARPSQCPSIGCWGIVTYRLLYHNKFGISGKTKFKQTRWDANDNHPVDWEDMEHLPFNECSDLKNGPCQIDEVKIIHGSDCVEKVE